MSIQSEIDRVNGNVASTYSVLSDLGADMPATTNTNNLPATATSVKAVLFGKSQSLTEAQKAQARTNIGAASAKDVEKIATTEEIVQQVIAALGTPVFGTVDEENNITLTGNLPNGTYTVKYEDADGDTIDIGTLTYSNVSYTNLADPSSADWLTNKRLNSSGAVVETTPSLTTNYTPLKLGDYVRIRYLDIRYQGSGTSNATTHFYDANKNRVASVTPATSDNTKYFLQDSDGLGYHFDVENVSSLFTFVSEKTAADIRYARFVGRLFDGYTADDIIITVNEEITE